MASPEPEILLTGESPTGVAMLIPLFDEASSFEEDEDDEFYYASSSSTSPSRCPCKMPERLRQRLAEWRTRTSPMSVEEIEAKLRDADHRRQRFYDQLSKKASPKRINLLQSGSSNEELERRIGARLMAAERKRQNNLAKLQMRLAKLDELRQAAKTRVEIRQEKERKELSWKVEFRFQKAEANRSLLLKKDRLRRASLRERRSQSKVRRMACESKHKELVCASISQKRAAAEKKRLGLLETKRRAHARFLQVQQTAQSVSHQREIERRRLREQMESRLQKAKTQRAEYLKQRGKKHLMTDQGDTLSRKLVRCWRHFREERRTTFSLAKAFDDLHINEKHVRLMPFEQLAHSIESRATLLAVKPLLDRLECRLRLSVQFCSENSPYRFSDIDHLLKKVAGPRRKVVHNNSRRRIGGAQKVGTSKEASKFSDKLSRYPIRLVLCAYMIIAHPDAVFSGRGDREVKLAKSATEFVKEFELLVKIILDGPLTLVHEESVSKRLTIRTQLAAFDSAWCIYLNNFVVWKVRDAESLEQDLVRAACQLELSMIQKCKLNAEGESVELTDDLKAIKKQVVDDQNLLREKVLRLSGDAGTRRLEQALSDSRSQYFQEKGSSSSSPTTPFLLPASPVSSFTPSVPVEKCDVGESRERPKNVVRSLFGEGSSRSAIDAGSSGEKVATENEIIVNDFVHKHSFPSADSSTPDHDINNVKEKIRETMEKAFWDGIMESLKQATPNYSRLLELMTEIRDELCKISPESWKEEIHGVINVEGLSKMLNAGNLDMDYLQKILEFALITLQKLSAPANDTRLREENEKLLKELGLECQVNDEAKQLHFSAVVKGLRFVLEQIQALKKQISTSRIRMVESLLNGYAGVEYLQTAFSERYGPPTDAVSQLPLTLQWISSVRRTRDQELEEHMNSLSSLTLPPPALTLRTGRNTLVENNETLAQQTSSEHPECKGELIDSLVRIGILKLVTRIEGLNPKDVPETLGLNFSRLRMIQAQVQKITVVLTSSLVLRQVILSRAIPAISSVNTENLLPRLVNQLSTILESNENAGIKEIVDVIGESLKEETNGENSSSLQSAKELIARVLVKSLQAGDSVFEKVSGAFYRAARGIMLGGSGAKGRELVKLELQKTGAAFLADQVVEVAAPLVAMATISVSVHGAWYANIVENGC